MDQSQESEPEFVIEHYTERDMIQSLLTSRVEYFERCRREPRLSELKALDPLTCTGQQVMDISDPNAKWDNCYSCDLCGNDVLEVVHFSQVQYNRTMEICRGCLEIAFNLLEIRPLEIKSCPKQADSTGLILRLSKSLKRFFAGNWLRRLVKCE